MMFLVYDGSPNCKKILLILEKFSIPFLRILDEQLRDSLVNENDSLPLAKTTQIKSVLFDGKSKVISQLNLTELCNVLNKYQFMIFHVGWAVRHDKKRISDICKKTLTTLGFINLSCKIAVSTDRQYAAEAKDYMDWWDTFSRCESILNREFNKTDLPLEMVVNNLRRAFKREAGNGVYEDLVAFLLHHFLPLDIDMQALKTAEDKKSYLNNMHIDLGELYELDKYYKERDRNKHYRQKLYDLWYLLEPSEENKRRASPEAKKLIPINNPHDDLLKLAGLKNGNPKESPIYEFLESLDKRKKDDNDLKEELDYLLTPFKSSGLKIGDNEIKSFHDWYCALASCLTGKEACKGK